MRTLKILSALLSYPEAETQAATREIWAEVARDTSLGGVPRAALLDHVEAIGGSDLLELQERWVGLFDRTRSLSLHLFEHVHGESRERGQAMVDLQDLYAEHGLDRVATEMPDYLPLFLEFLSILPADRAIELLGETVHILTTLAERLEKRQSSYAAIFRALTEIADRKPAPAELAVIVPDDGVEADDLEALDALWEDQPVEFGPDAADCGVDSLGSRLRAARRPAPGMTPPPAAPRPTVTHSRSLPGS